ncbi:MAG TPA: helix-turn-helix domain-containing protein [Acidimicrobiia bacterium]|nr:helix-turn-helix domain-containing protein [Acidimicrobiia bacterium]
MSYLTTRDLQELIRVDKSTIYRMADAGRLPAIKVGRQWRFPEDAVMAWLGAAAPGDGATVHAAPGLADLVPAPIAQAIADLAAEAMGVMVVITDMDGRPLTEVTNPCGLYRAVAKEPGVLSRCVEMWAHYGAVPDLVPRFGPSEFGFLCARAFVRREAELLGMIIAGGVAPADWPPQDSQIAAMAAGFGIPMETVANHIEDVYQLTQEERVHVLTVLPRIGVLISELAQQRDLQAAATPPDPAERRSAS